MDNEPSHPVLPNNTFTLPGLPTALELDESSHPSQVTLPNWLDTPPTRNTLDADNGSTTTPDYGQGTEALQTLSRPRINRFRILAACLMNACNGMNDSAPGALVPYLEEEYHIGYAIVSLIFVANAAGFVSAAASTHIIQKRLGRAKSYVLAEAFLIVAYIMLVCQPPFGVIALAFYFAGFGMSINLALNNVFCANLAEGTTALGILHGSYGLGGTIGPLIATALVTRRGSWASFYYITLCVAAICLVLAFYSFRNFEGRPTTQYQDRRPSTGDRAARSSYTKLQRRAIRNKTTVLGALFTFAYQGAEVSISGWVISFLISYRHSARSQAGFVTSGFWGGITLGRFLLSHPAHEIGEKRATFILITGAIAFQILVWLVPNIIGGAVAVSIVGLLLGPIYPCATAVYSLLISAELQMSSLSIISALGSSGGAFAPFFTGLLAQKSGTWVLHPICIGLFVGMICLWAGLPRVEKRRQD